MTGASPHQSRALQGVRVVITRARPGHLDEQLGALGAHIVSAPAIATVDADDRGAALRRAAGQLVAGSYDWLVVTSATAAERLADAGGLPVPDGTRVAAIGPPTAAATGQVVDLLPPEAVAESLVEAFPSGSGRVLVLRPEITREVVGAGLRAKGWQVDEVVAYRTVAAPLSASTRSAIRTADVITFTSPSTVDNTVAAVGVDALPGTVVAIGPVTRRALGEHGITADAVATPHTVDGLVDAVVRAVTGSGAGRPPLG